MYSFCWLMIDSDFILFFYNCIPLLTTGQTFGKVFTQLMNNEMNVFQKGHSVEEGLGWNMNEGMFSVPDLWCFRSNLCALCKNFLRLWHSLSLWGERTGLVLEALCNLITCIFFGRNSKQGQMSGMRRGLSVVFIYACVLPWNNPDNFVLSKDQSGAIQFKTDFITKVHILHHSVNSSKVSWWLNVAERYP